MDLLVAGIVVLLLFVATYSQRRTWIALGSTALTIVLIAAGVLFSTAQGSSQIRDGLAQLAKALPGGWDRPALELTAAIENASTSLARARDHASRQSDAMLAASVADWLSWGAWFGTDTDAEAAPGGEPEAKPATGTASNAPIKWFLDEPSRGETFAVSGANVSDQPLKVVRAVLKPDSSAGKLKLTLRVDGQEDADGQTVPPGTRFSLEAADLTASDAKELGGAILSMAYAQAGRRKTSIMYLTQDLLAQDAE